MSKLRPETVEALAATYARILERKYPGLAFDVRPREASEGEPTATLRNGQRQLVTFDHERPLADRQSSSTNKDRVEHAGKNLTLLNNVKVSHREANKVVTLRA